MLTTSDYNGSDRHEKFRGQTYAVEKITVPVSSDRAWLDTGNRLVVKNWDGLRAWNHTVSTDDIVPDVVVDLPGGRDNPRLDAWLYTNDWLSKQYAAQHEHYRASCTVSTGDLIEVYAGRKVPKGLYRLSYRGEGNFGPYYHLTAVDGGKQFNYVSVKNCRKPAGPAWVATLPWTENRTAVALATAAVSASRQHGSLNDNTVAAAQAFLVLADCLEELGFEQVAEHIRHQPGYTERQGYDWNNEPDWVSLAEPLTKRT